MVRDRSPPAPARRHRPEEDDDGVPHVKRKNILRSAGGVLLAPMVLLSGCPQQCAPAPAPPPRAAPPAPPAPPPPPGGQFLATFNTAADFYNRFDTYTGNYCTAGVTCRPEGNGGVASFPGDHNTACAAPTTQRTVSIANHSNLFWHCAPGGDAAKGHIMVGLETSGYAITAFSPKQSFNNVARICWDVSLTNLGGGKWFNVVIVPEATFVANPNRNPTRAAEKEGPYRLDYTSPGFNASDAPGDFNIQGGPTAGVKIFQNSLSVWTNNASDNFVWTGPGLSAGDDRATRYRHCITDNRNGTLTLTQHNRSHTFGGSLPRGRVRVIFQDDTYDSIKHDGRPGFKTWHVDNISIS